MLVWKRLLALVPLALLGCGGPSGLTRNAIQERMNEFSLQSPDAAIADVRGLKPQLQFPCRIAVYLKPGDQTWRWTPEDKNAMQQWGAELKREGIASDVFALPEFVVNSSTGKSDLMALRLAAARCGADALFVVHAATQTDSYKNFATVFDLTIIGGYIIPASHRDSLFAIEGVLLDVDNGYIYTAVQAEGEGKIIRPTFVIADKDAVAKAKAQALIMFGNEVLNHMRALAATPPSQRINNYQNVQRDEPKTKPVPSTPATPIGLVQIPSLPAIPIGLVQTNGTTSVSTMPPKTTP